MSYVMYRVRHARGYAAYARNDGTAKHKAVFSWEANGTAYCICGHPVSVVAYSVIDGQVIR